MVHVAHKGSAPATQDLLGGHVQAMFADLPQVVGHIKAGKLQGHRRRLGQTRCGAARGADLRRGRPAGLPVAILVRRRREGRHAAGRGAETAGGHRCGDGRAAPAPGARADRAGRSSPIPPPTSAPSCRPRRLATAKRSASRARRSTEARRADRTAGIGMASLIARARSFLFVPATRPERYAKALASGAGAVIVDLEDAVAPGDKDEARAQLARGLAGFDAAQLARTLVRINAVGTPWHAADVALLAQWTARGLAGAMLPKAECAAALARARRFARTGRATAAAGGIGAGPRRGRPARARAGRGAARLRAPRLPARRRHALRGRRIGAAAGAQRAGARLAPRRPGARPVDGITQDGADARGLRIRCRSAPAQGASAASCASTQRRWRSCRCGLRAVRGRAGVGAAGAGSRTHARPAASSASTAGWSMRRCWPPRGACSNRRSSRGALPDAHRPLLHGRCAGYRGCRVFRQG